MPFASVFPEPRLIERVLRVRQHGLLAYPVALLIVTIASLARWMIDDHVVTGMPFITYYPAIVLATLLCGFWPGILATLSSAVIAWYVFTPLNAAPERIEVISLVLFIAMSGVNVVLVGLLNAGLERTLAHQRATAALIESAPSGIVLVDELGTVRMVNASAEQLFGFHRDELLGKPVRSLIPAVDEAVHRSVCDSRDDFPHAEKDSEELSGRRKDGSEFPAEVRLRTIRRDGSHAVLATVTDISERKRARDHQQLIVKELHHRTRNLFSVVQAVVLRSLCDGQTILEARRALIGRLAALANAYSTLAEAAWNGAPLESILSRELSGFSTRYHIEGCDIVINSGAAQHLSLLVHELATNAVKYGALSAPNGHIAIDGRIERSNGEDWFFFTWKESGGPAVAQPLRKGFGTTLLLEDAKRSGRNVILRFDPGGLNYELRLRLSGTNGQ